jgi:acetyltransferase-like isoleucine patch superfamily enzyme
MLTILKKILSFVYLKVKFRNLVKFGFSVTIRRSSVFEGMNKLYPNSFFSGELGFGSYVSTNSIIVAKVGRYTSIGPDVKVIIGTHPFTYPYASTSPVFFSIKKQNGGTFVKEQRFKEMFYLDKNETYSVIIGNDCWIGDRVLILNGVTIGDGAILLAGAVITKDVPPYAIAGGVPSKILKYRYNQNTIDFLLKFKWWNKDIEWLKSNAELICNVNGLEEKYKI